MNTLNDLASRQNVVADANSPNTGPYYTKQSRIMSVLKDVQNNTWGAIRLVFLRFFLSPRRSRQVSSRISEEVAQSYRLISKLYETEQPHLVTRFHDLAQRLEARESSREVLSELINLNMEIASLVQMTNLKEMSAFTLRYSTPGVSRKD